MNSSFFSFCGASAQRVPRPSSFEFSRSRIIRNAHTPVRPPLRGRYQHNTQGTQETNIHALSRIGTCDPSISGAADLGVFPHGHMDCTQHPSYFLATTFRHASKPHLRKSGNYELTFMLWTKYEILIAAEKWSKSGNTDGSAFLLSNGTENSWLASRWGRKISLNVYPLLFSLPVCFCNWQYQMPARSI
jgi:hypothetical protein